MATAYVTNPKTEAAILGRVIQTEHGDLTPEIAQAVLGLQWPREDLDRIHELVTRNQDGNQSIEKRAELESYLRIGALIDLMHAKARRSLKTRS